jgi:hypothetical protein
MASYTHAIHDGDGGGMWAGGGAGESWTGAARRQLLGSASAGGHPPPQWELVALCAILGVCLCLQLLTSTRIARSFDGGPAELATFQRLRRRYNIVYTLGTFGDWIQAGLFNIRASREPSRSRRRYEYS